MFDSDMSLLLKPSPPRNIPPLNLFLRSFIPKQKTAYARASHLATQSQGMRLLTYLLNLSDIPYMETVKDPWSVIDLDMESFIRSLSRQIDPQQNGIVSRKIFISSPTPCCEVLFPITREDPYGTLPIGLPYDQGWDKIRPLRLLEMSDSELTFQFYRGTIDFRENGPKIAIFGIDLLAFVLKYLAYRQTLPVDQDRMYAVQNYVFQEVLLPCFVEDTFALWMRNFYHHAFFNTVPEYHFLDAQWTTANGGMIGSEYNHALQTILDLKTQLTNKTLPIPMLLHSLLLTPDLISLPTWFGTMTMTCQTPLQQQYLWIDGLKSFGWMELMFRITQLGGDTNLYVTFKNRIRRDVVLLDQMRPWSHIQNTEVQDYLKTRFRSFLQMTQI